MKSLVTRINAVNPVASFCFALQSPLLFKAWHGASSSGESVAEQADGKTMSAAELFSNVWTAMVSPGKRPCMECLVDIAKDAERCPNCSALQSSEACLLSRHNMRWH